ncbi:hypothetical protein Ahy_B05g075133 [Arachis hypogaea]|uniref:Aminotransferase-like plant mobile domain-containing protein n=1 Tax=Arachis hypogaea TaxID=3818 RepID=A0A444Z0I8_ARAHY|nr:hypothetical protein Ahy_B05g075133 [Arachis hypogaea]
MLSIDGYLMTDKWLPLLADFGRCSGLSWGSVTYHSLCHAACRDTTGIAGCTLLLMSLIYHKFSQRRPENSHILTFPLAMRLIGMSHQTRDHHAQRVLRWRTLLDQLALDKLHWTPYVDDRLQAITPKWVRTPREWRTWLSVVPLVFFNIMEFYQPNRVKRQFKGEQLVPVDSVNVDWFLTSTGRGEDVRWPTRLHEPGTMACKVRHLSGEDVLDDPRLATILDDVQPTLSQPIEVLQFPADVPDHQRRAREVRPDTRRPARKERGARDSEEELQGLDESKPDPDVESEEEAEFNRHEDHGDILNAVDELPPPPPPSPPPPPPPGPPASSAPPVSHFAHDNPFTAPPGWVDLR